MSDTSPLNRYSSDLFKDQQPVSWHSSQTRVKFSLVTEQKFRLHFPAENMSEMCQLFTCSFPQAVIHECAPLSGITLSYFPHCFGTDCSLHSFIIIWTYEEGGGYDCVFNSAFCYSVFIIICHCFPFRRSRRQDIIHGNPLTQCRGFNLKGD